MRKGFRSLLDSAVQSSQQDGGGQQEHSNYQYQLGHSSLSQRTDLSLQTPRGFAANYNSHPSAGPSHLTGQRPMQSPSSPEASTRDGSPYSTAQTSPQALPTIFRGTNYGLTVVHDAGPTSKMDVVFVHGLTGNAYTTWLHKQTEVHWPSQLLPRDLPNCRILCFGFDADVASFWNPVSKSRLSNHASNLVGNLVQRRERTDTEERRIVFVCHSLGGLVVQRALSHSRNSYENHIRQIEHCTHGLVFMGTPHHGSDLASWAKFGTNIAGVVQSTNKDILAVLEPGSEVLDQVQGSFHSLLRMRKDENREIAITCFWEKLDVKGIGQIVPEHSAKIPGYECYGILANHMDMTKFPDSDDPGYDLVFGELLRWNKTAAGGQRHTTRSHERGNGTGLDSTPPALTSSGMRDADAAEIFDSSVALRTVLQDRRYSMQRIASCIERFDRAISAALSHHRETLPQAGLSDASKYHKAILSSLNLSAQMDALNLPNPTYTASIPGNWSNLIQVIEQRMEQIKSLRRTLSPDDDQNSIDTIFGGLNSDDFLIDIVSLKV